MLCIPKKNNKLCTIIDVWKQNKNMIRDVTSFPNQEKTQMDVAWGWYQSKINMSDTYEHIQVKPDDVWKTVFSNVFSTFLSLTMQQGDCNAPATFQWLMTMTFHKYIGKFMHIYLDNIFIYSDSIKEHKKYLGLMYTKLYKAELYLVLEKLNLFLKWVNCLSHLINDQGTHVDSDRMARIHKWRTPRNKHNMQCFLGLVNYIAHFMPDI